MQEKLFNCPVEATISQIGGKYKAIILYHLLDDGVLRFHELQHYLPQATPPGVRIPRSCSVRTTMMPNASEASTSMVL